MDTVTIIGIVGVAVAVIAVIVAVVIGKLQINLAKKQTAIVPAPVLGEIVDADDRVIILQGEDDFSNFTPTHPSPTEIYNAIDKLPLYQQKQAEKSYEGLQVRWDLRLFLLHQHNENEWSVTLVSPKINHPSIWVRVNPEQYPELKIAKDRQRVLLIGKIESIAGSNITINDFRLKVIL